MKLYKKFIGIDIGKFNFVVGMFSPQSKQALDLCELVSRRNDLKQLLVAEKNRLQGPRAQLIKDSCAKQIASLVGLAP
jgi:transposase